jgi:2-polyprenyl-6-hydroxyphenyl methylase/3-demethylubiquinone-9 3-methyltransferase
MANRAQQAAEKRFEFGRNWQRFLATLDDERIARAEASLSQMLAVADLRDTTFLDIGCGSGLFSLAARRLGARVHSFDNDPQSVACARELKRRYYPDDLLWTIDVGSVLVRSYLETVGSFDVVYSWGVLHHTGALWQALENATVPLTPGGRLFIAIYNRQLVLSRLNAIVKRTYVSLPRVLRPALAAPLVALQLIRNLAADALLFRNPLERYRSYGRARGMSWWHDCLDWIGGYPFETATPQEVFDFFQPRGFVLERLTTCGGGSGCNQFVFRKALDSWTWSKHPFVLSVVEGSGIRGQGSGKSGQ